MERLIYGLYNEKVDGYILLSPSTTNRNQWEYYTTSTLEIKSIA